MVKRASIQKRLKEIHLVSNTPADEVTIFFNKTLRFLEQHTSCDQQRAIQIALNETSIYFKGEVL